MFVPLQSGAEIAVLVVALVGVVLVVLGLREVVLGLRFLARRPTPIGSVGESSGKVTISGVARRADGTVTAPVTRTTCLAYTWRVSTLQTSRSLDGKLRTRRGTVGTGHDAVPFLLEDDTGSVLVDARGAELRLVEEWVDDPARDPVDRPDVLTGDVFGGDLFGSERHREYTEARLDEGETVTVRGTVTADGTVDVGRLGVRIAGGIGTLIEDATPGDAAKRAFFRAAYTAGTGGFVLGILAVIFFAP